MATSMGVSVIVENRPGAGGTIGTDLVVNAPADGYTILLGSPSPLTVAPSLYKKLPYDPQRDLIPITLAATVPNILVVHPSVPATTVKELIAYAKANPDKLNFASSGNGGSGHLGGEMFNVQAGTKMQHIPYKGSISATTALIAGDVQVAFGDMLNTLPHVKSGRLRALAVTTMRRSPAMPDLPSIAEAGVSSYDAGTWYGVLVAAKTPPEIVTRITAEVIKALNQADVRATFAKEGGELLASTPEKFAEHIRMETARWATVLKEANVKVD
jgi:tripartite-type tricarboxylate transporter receptor subunit TctC